VSGVALAGQTLLSAAVADRLRDDAPLEELGLNRLRDLSPRYRIDKIAQLTGRDAATTAGRVYFTLALAIRRDAG
jgi:hypothetical protein